MVSDEDLSALIRRVTESHRPNAEIGKPLIMAICTELLARRKAIDTILKAVSKIEEFELQNKDKIFSSGKAEYGNLIQWTNFTIESVLSEMRDLCFVIKSELNTFANNKGVL